MSEREREISVDRPCCPFCRDDLRVDQEKIGCSACMAWHHADCWREHGACSACGASARGDSEGQSEAAADREHAALLQISELARRGQQTQAIAEYRALKGGDRESAQAAVADLAHNPPLPVGPVHPAIEDYLRKNLTISAIKLYRELHGCDLRTAKRAIDAIREQLGLADGEEDKQAAEMVLAGLFVLVIVGLLFALSTLG